MVNSEFLNGLSVEEAKNTIIKKIEIEKIGKKQTLFRLKDWGISRQRYWGCPIPIVYLEDGTIETVDKVKLSVTLPDNVNLTPLEILWLIIQVGKKLSIKELENQR